MERAPAEVPLGVALGPAAPAAGISAYVQLYGHDTLFTGFQALMAMPTILRDALRIHAHRQGTRIDNHRDEEPGKMFDQVRSIASNAGQLLATGIVPVEKGRQVARRMMAPDMFSDWGIRTLSSDHVAYHPFSYHLGSVWPAENGTVVFGFARYGCWEEAHQLAERLFALTDLSVENRLPEDVGGFPRDELHPHPGIYPAANEPQSWPDGMIILTIRALLGMRAFAPLHLLLIDPHLPIWLPDVRLERLRVGEARVALDFRRGRSGKTVYRVTRKEGQLHVLRQPVPQGPDATIPGRIRTALASLVPTL